MEGSSTFGLLLWLWLLLVPVVGAWLTMPSRGAP
jgi:hypothetical protein